MVCPKCQSKTVVIDSRTKENNHIRRRRKCLICNYRFTTYEEGFIRQVDFDVVYANKIIFDAHLKPLIAQSHRSVIDGVSVVVVDKFKDVGFTFEIPKPNHKRIKLKTGWSNA